MIQQYIDDYVKDRIFLRSADMWVTINENGSIDSEKSAIIGQLYGGALRLFCNTQGKEEKNIHPTDLAEFNNLFLSKLEGLEKQVRSVLTKNTNKEG